MELDLRQQTVETASGVRPPEHTGCPAVVLNCSLRALHLEEAATESSLVSLLLLLQNSKFKGEGSLCIPMVDSCWMLAETSTIL